MPLVHATTSTPAGWDMVAHIVAHGASGTVTTPPIDTTGADLIIVSTATDSQYGAVTDNRGNSYVAIASNTGFNGGGNAMWYAAGAISVGPGHSFTVQPGGGFGKGLMVWAIAGAAVAPLDQFTSRSIMDGGDAPAGPITPTTDNQLIVASVTVGNATGGTDTIDGGFTIGDSVPFIGGSNYGGCTAYLAQTAAATAGPTFSGNQYSATTIASFKGA